MHWLPSPACWRILYPFSSFALNSKCFLDPSHVLLLCSAASFSWPVSFPPEHTPTSEPVSPPSLPFIQRQWVLPVCLLWGGDPCEAFPMAVMLTPTWRDFPVERLLTFMPLQFLFCLPLAKQLPGLLWHVCCCYDNSRGVSAVRTALCLSPNSECCSDPAQRPHASPGSSCDPVRPLAGVSLLPPVTGLRLRKHLREALFLTLLVFLETSSEGFVISTSLLVSQPAACVKLGAESWHLSVSLEFSFHYYQGWRPPVIALALTMTPFSEWQLSHEWVSVGRHPAQLAGGFII